MEEHLNPTPLPQPVPKKKWFRSVWVSALFLIILGAGGYYGYTQIDNQKLLNKMFAQYARTHPKAPSISTDTIVPSITEQGFRDTSVVVSDTAMVSNDEPPEKDSLNSVGENPPVEIPAGRLLDVDTTSKVVVDEPVIFYENEAIESPRKEGGLFEELMLSDNLKGKEARSFNNFYNGNIVSSKSVLKLLSIAGKNILSADNAADDRNILQALEESENISGILIADRKGVVVYATNRKLLNKSIRNIMPEIDSNSSSLNWYQHGLQSITSLPLYHTYGKIGTAILITE